MQKIKPEHWACEYICFKFKMDKSFVDMTQSAGQIFVQLACVVTATHYACKLLGWTLVDEDTSPEMMEYLVKVMVCDHDKAGAF